jgi:Family of unknown function (DUF6496)
MWKLFPFRLSNTIHALEIAVPDKQTIERAKKDLRSGKSPGTAAGEFVRQEIHHVREGKHGVRNAKQAIAIGLSEARRAGVPIPDQPGKSRKAATSKRRASIGGTAKSARSSTKRARASLKRLKSEPRSGASHLALSRHAHKAANQRSARARSASAKKAARTRAARTR